MANEIFNEPRLALNRIYTKGGDKGETSLVGGQRVPKDDPRIDAFGSVDELNAFIGLARVSCQDLSRQTSEPRIDALAAILLRVQHELFNLGSILATRPADVHPKQPRVTDAEVEQLEREIDEANADLTPLRSFRTAGRHALECRATCRAYHLPPGGTSGDRAGADRRSAARDDPLFESSERCAICLEPFCKSDFGSRGGSVATESNGVGIKGRAETWVKCIVTL